MRLTFVALIVGVVVGYARKGRFVNVGRALVRQPGLLIAGVVLQAGLAALDGAAATIALFGSLGFLLAFAARNLHFAGMELIAAGVALNALVMALNGGAMPVGADALAAAGAGPGDLAAVADAKHRLEREGDRLLLLADVVGLRPLREVVSAGDIAIAAGLVVALPTLMSPVRARRRRYAS